MNKDKKNEFKQKIEDKYKLIIMNKAFEEKFSLELSILKVFVLGTLTIITLIALTTTVITLTPLKEYIPGYGSSKQNKKLFDLQVQVDSLKSAIDVYDTYFSNIQQVFKTEDFSGDTDAFKQKAAISNKSSTFAFTKEDSILMNMCLLNEKQSNDAVNIKKESKIERNMMFQPVFGKLKSFYSISNPSVGIYTPTSQQIYAISDGNIIYCDAEEKLIFVQHTDNRISIYKNFFTSLVKTGENVYEGQIIAKSKPNSDLKFGLWINGKSVNPQNYFAF